MSAIGGTATSTTFDEVQAAMKRVALVNDTSWSFCHGLDTSGEPTTMGNEVRQYCDLVVRQKSSCAKANGLFPTTITNGTDQLDAPVGFTTDLLILHRILLVKQFWSRVLWMESTRTCSRRRY